MNYLFIVDSIHCALEHVIYVIRRISCYDFYIVLVEKFSVQHHIMHINRSWLRISVWNIFSLWAQVLINRIGGFEPSQLGHMCHSAWRSSHSATRQEKRTGENFYIFSVRFTYISNGNSRSVLAHVLSFEYRLLHAFPERVYPACGIHQLQARVICGTLEEREIRTQPSGTR